MSPFPNSPSPGGRGPQRPGPFSPGPGRGPARGPYRGPDSGPPRGYGRPPARDFGSGPAPRPSGYDNREDRPGAGPDRSFRPRTSFRPDGSRRDFDAPRPPRPGRVERDAIKAGTRPFFRGGARPANDRGDDYGRGAPGGYRRGPSAEFGEPGQQRVDHGVVPQRLWRKPDDGFEGNDDQPWGGGRAPQFGGPRQDRPAGARPERSFGPPRERAFRDDSDRRGPARPVRPGGAEGRSFDRPPRREAPARDAGADYDAEPMESELERSNIDLAVMVIEKATPRIPADLLLRQTLSRRKRLTRGDSAWISRAVFSFYRWMHWLPENAPLIRRIEGALELANRFAANPAEVSEAELIRRAVPEWIGGHLNLTGEWVRALQTEPPLWLRARKGAVSDVKNILGNSDPSGFARFPQSFRYVGEEDLFRHELFQAGAFEIQDIASQAVGLICDPQPNETWWDTCAGEGGKTLHLSDLMDGKGLIWATDRSEWRLDRLKMRAGRAGCFNYRSRAWDGSANLPTKTEFDGILVDAPCSGIGTWGRNPHSRWTVTPQDVAELAVIQKQILHNAASALKVGGRLIYSVCTVSRAETSDLATALTQQHPELEPLPLENPFVPGSAPVTALTLWPQDTQGNGMFVAAWRRKA